MTRTGPDPAELTERTQRIRRSIVRMCSVSSGGHLGGSMSLVEILTTLYTVLDVDPRHPDAPDRDIVLLSKGHGAIGLYATLAEFGFFPEARLADYGRAGAPFIAHPNTELPGVEIPSGALGHGLPVAIGFALGARLAHQDRRRVVVVMGDGEQQEGSVWEGAMAASSLGLDNLTAVVDRNGLQITGRTEDVVTLEPLAGRWRSFGWTVREVDGHDLGALWRATTDPPEAGRPTLVLAATVKGRGLPYIEDDVRSHFARLGARQVQRALSTLQAGSEGR